MFQVDEWYLDLVTPEGTAAVLYSARLRWGALGDGRGLPPLQPAVFPSGGRGLKRLG